MNINIDSEFKNQMIDCWKFYSNKIVSKTGEETKNNHLSIFELESQTQNNNNLNNINDNKDNSFPYQNDFDISPIVTNKISSL